MKGFLHKIPAPRIFFCHVGNLKAGMRDITSPTTAHLHFRKQLTALFENDDPQRRIFPGGIDRTEKTSRTTADDDQFFSGHTSKINPSSEGLNNLILLHYK